MGENSNQLEAYYINYNNDIKFKNEDLLKKALKTSIMTLVVPGGIIYEAYKGINNLSVKTKSSNIKRIESPEQLNTYTNLIGNDWLFSDNDSYHFYFKYPKMTSSNYLIDAKEFNKYIYDEYCTELINYCRSHCKAKKIEITQVKLSDIKTGGKYRGVGGNITGCSGKENVFVLDSPKGIEKVKPLKEYFWLEKRLMIAIDGLKEGGSIVLKDRKDFSFGIGSDALKLFGANLEFANSYEFSILIES